MSDSDDTIRAKLVRTLHRGGFFEPRSISVQGLANRSGVATSDEGRAAELAHELAREDASPVIYKRVGNSVMLEVDSEDWAVAFIRRHDPEQLMWDWK